MAISAVVWVTTMGVQYFQFSGIVRARSVWVPSKSECTTLDLKIVRTSAVNALVTDVTLLRIRLRDGAFMNLTYILWKEANTSK